MIPLLILGLLTENPGAHGYELLALMKQRNYQYIVSFTKGSFYYNLQQLEDKGRIKQVDKGAAPSPKEPHHYEITEEGTREFMRLMERYGSQTDYVNLSFYAAMLFSEYYDQDKFKALIQSQIDQTQAKIRALEETLAHRQQVQPSFGRMLENSRSHHLVNLQWFQQLLTDPYEDANDV